MAARKDGTGAGRLRGLALMAALAAAFVTGSAAAQIQSVDPDKAIDGDLARPAASSPVTSSPAASAPPASAPATTPPPAASSAPAAAPAATAAGAVNSPATAATTATNDTTWHKDDLIGAAQGVFGKGATGLAEMIEDLLRKQGEPNAYIVGREGGGAIMFGLRYGSGTLYHKVEGQKPVYWTGPSLGIDVGGNAGNAMVLVYNLYDSEELYHRFGAGEGQAYLIGGFHISYLRRGNIVLIPVRMGAGMRLGANVGYMKFSHTQKWLPF